jgi:outer membrane protein OmpA-like peptidoglycan-associated protein
MKKVLIAVGLVSMPLVGMAQLHFTKSSIGFRNTSVTLNGGNTYDILRSARTFVAPGIEGQDLVGLQGNPTKFDWVGGITVHQQVSPILGVGLFHNRTSLSGKNAVEYYLGRGAESGLVVTQNWSYLNPLRTSSKWSFGTGISLSQFNFESSRYLISDNTDINSESGSPLAWGLEGRLMYAMNARLSASANLRYLEVRHDGVDGWDYGAGSDPFMQTRLGLTVHFGAKEKPRMEYMSIFSKDLIDASPVAQLSGISQAAQKEAMGDQIDSLSKVLSKNILEQAKGQLLTASTLLEVAKNSEAIREAIREEMKVTSGEQRVEMHKELANSLNMAVFFNVASSELLPDGKQELFIWWMNVQSHLNNPGSAKVYLSGYADRRDSKEYNESLRKRRAESVKAWLVEYTSLTAEQIILEDVPQSFTPDYMIDRRVQVRVTW